jgi:DNA-binding MarR family transcriptional regulator
VTDSAWGSASAILRLATELIDGIQRGVSDDGFGDVRPAHGFAFVRLSESPATTAQLALHLGITKQATSELVMYLVAHGYVTRTPDPNDGRASLLLLTARGHACTHAARRAAERTIGAFEARLSPQQVNTMHAILTAMAVPGRLRPGW